MFFGDALIDFGNVEPFLTVWTIFLVDMQTAPTLEAEQNIQKV